MPGITPKGAAMSEKSRHDSALINTSPGSASPQNPGKTAKIVRKTLKKRQKQAKTPWKNGKNHPKSLGKTAKTNYFCKKADSAWHYSDT